MPTFLRLTITCFALAAALPASAQGPQVDPMAVTAPAPSASRIATAAPGTGPGPTDAAIAGTSDAAIGDGAVPPDTRGKGPAAEPPAERDGPGTSPWTTEKPSEGLAGTLVRMLLVLGLVVALIYLTLNFGLRKLVRAPLGQGGLVKVHERVGLEPKKSLVLVEAAGEFLLLGLGEREVSVLSRLDAERTREALEAKARHKADARPFWERLAVKPSARNPKSGSGGGPASGPLS